MDQLYRRNSTRMPAESPATETPMGILIYNKSPPNHITEPQDPIPQIRSNQIRSHRTTRLLLRLKPQPKLPSPPFLTNSIQKPSNALLLRQTRTIKMLPHHKRECIFAHAVLSDYPAQWLFALASTSASATTSTARGVRRCSCSCGMVLATVVPG